MNWRWSSFPYNAFLLIKIVIDIKTRTMINNAKRGSLYPQANNKPNQPELGI